MLCLVYPTLSRLLLLHDARSVIICERCGVVLLARSLPDLLLLTLSLPSRISCASVETSTATTSATSTVTSTGAAAKHGVAPRGRHSSCANTPTSSGGCRVSDSARTCMVVCVCVCTCVRPWLWPSAAAVVHVTASTFADFSDVWRTNVAANTPRQAHRHTRQQRRHHAQARRQRHNRPQVCCSTC